ncbi:MAG: M48 family metallopeptidase [Rhodanobacteraceae bacterium]
MNFFVQQSQARKQTRRMIVLFALAVIAIVCAIDAALLLVLGSRGAQIDWHAIAAVSAVVIAVIGLGSLYRVASLAGGGAAVAQQLGATPVPPDTTNFAYRRLRNVIEEMSIAAGMPVPEVFVLEDEAAINAFASGFTTADAAVTVTRGCLDKLTRDELQGVIGHEFSHVLNGDMRLNIRLMGVVFGILVIAVVGRKIAFASSYSRSRNSGGVVMFGFALLAIGYIGVLFGRMIKASISRQREYLADASSVQFTRQPSGIAGALKKIGGLAEGSRLANRETEEVAHMLFGDGVGYSALFATHPPLGERIRRIEPNFDVRELDAIAAAWEHPRQVGDSEGAAFSIGGFAPAGAAVAAATVQQTHLPNAAAKVTLSPNHVVQQVGNPETDDRRAAAMLHASMPDALRASAYSQQDAMALMFALVLNVETDLRARQLALIERYYEAGTRERTVQLSAEVDRLHPIQRLPLAALTFPALRKRPRPQLQTFLLVLNQLAEADNRVSLQEYCLVRLIGVQVIEALDPASARAIGRTHLPELARELTELFAIVAEHGHDDAEAAARAYALGLNEVLPNHREVYAPVDDFAPALDRALPRLDLLAPAGKELVVRGLTRAISADGEVTVAEAELLRTICAAIHCPLPPMLQGPS